MSNGNGNPIDLRQFDLGEIVNGLLERYSGEWERTQSRRFGTNEGALRHICHSPRLASVTNIVIYGLGNGGSFEEQVLNATDALNNAYLDYSQRIFFTQIGVARTLRELLQERFQLEPRVYACDPEFTEHDIACLRVLNIDVVQPAREGQRVWHDAGTLIYDVTKLRPFITRSIDFSWHGRHVPPAAILTCLTSLMRNRAPPRPGDLPVAINPAFLRKYHMTAIMDLNMAVEPSIDEALAVEAIRNRQQRDQARARLRERESLLTLEGYERMLVHHNAVMDQFDQRIRHRINYLEEYYAFVQDEEGFQNAADQADEELTPLVPRDTNSYIYDPMMVLLYRKEAPTEEPR